MEVTRNFDLLTQLQEKYSKPAAVALKRNGVWTEFSTEEYISTVNDLSYGLLQIGIGKGDKVAIISNNRPEWNFADFGVSQLGAITVPMYPTLGENDMKYILNDSETQCVFVETSAFLDKILAIRAEVPTLTHIYMFDPVDGVAHWTELRELGAQNPAPAEVEALKNSIDTRDLMTLIYTSGTTGVPKGVMLSHSNIISNVREASRVCPVRYEHKVLSFLPLCHIFERMICYMYHYMGASIYYAESMETIGDNLKEVKPFAFSTVPRLLEKVYDRIIGKGHELKGIKKNLFFWAVNLGKQYKLNRANSGWYYFKLKIADKLIFSKWREALGGNTEVIVVGGAALQPRLATIFTAAGINVLEGYGLTETSPVIAVNRMEEENRMFGTVGPVLNGVEVKIAQDGEILCKGPNVMMGYYKQPALTAEVLQDGWFHTGDIGTLVDNKFLKITDRKKEVFKTSGGKYIAPQPMENKFKESIYIEQIMIIGEGQKMPAALIVPAWEVLQKWCSENGVAYGDPAAVIRELKVLELYRKEIDKYNEGYGDWETIKKFALIPGEWSVNGGEMTPKLSLRRKPILEKYKDLVDQIYGNTN